MSTQVRVGNMAIRPKPDVRVLGVQLVSSLSSVISQSYSDRCIDIAYSKYVGHESIMGQAPVHDRVTVGASHMGTYGGGKEETGTATGAGRNPDFGTMGESSMLTAQHRHGSWRRNW